MTKRWGRLPFAPPKLSSALLAAALAHFSTAIVTHSRWLLRGYQPLFRFYFDYQDPLFLITCTLLEFSVALRAWKQFSPQQPLRHAWLIITGSAACHLIGMVMSHGLCLDSNLNPLYTLHAPWYPHFTAVVRPLGLLIGGPLQMMILAGGLYLPLRLCRQYGIRGRLKKIDWMILVVVVGYALRVAYVVIHMRIGTSQPLGVYEVMNWTGDPLLCVLLFLAFFLRRAVAQMGWGYVTRCWGAYVVAILGTSVASMATWATNYGILPYPENAFLWYIWPLIYVAYALAPIYQVEASEMASERLENFGESLEKQEE